MEEKSVNQNYQKYINARLVRKQLYLNGPISRIDIAQNLGLTTPAIGAIVAPLLASGLVREKPDTDRSTGAGRPRLMLEFVPEAYYICGVELGPYYTNFALTDLCGHLVASRKTKQPMDMYDKTMPRLKQEIGVFLREHFQDFSRILGVGLVMPGLVDGQEGRIYTTFREGWTEHDPAAELAEELGLPVYIENNVRAKVIATSIFDRMVTEEPFAYLSVYYGVACQMIMGDQILYGNNAAAGEIGHMVVQRGGPVCTSCGNRGCLEAVAGERAILTRCREKMQATAGCLLWRHCDTPEDLTMEAVLSAQREGDPVVEEIMADAMEYLGIALANIINLISPKSVVVDGRLFRLPKNRKMLLAAAEDNMFMMHRTKTKVKFLEHDALRGARGAAALVVKELLTNGKR